MIRIFLAALFIVLSSPSNAHFPDRPDLNNWFAGLTSKKGMCCSFADGVALTDIQWDITNDGHYRVFLDNQWVRVPDDAVLTEPNRYGQAVVWPYRGPEPGIQIRCFMPGAGT